MFNRETGIKRQDIVWPDFLYFELTEWVPADNMSAEEKSEHPSYTAVGGYLRTYEYKEAFRKAWDKASQEDRDKLFALPNFDAAIFEEISGIDVTAETGRKHELLAKGDELIAKAEELKAEAEKL